MDDLLPDAGDTVKLSLKASRISATQFDDARVRLKLDNGLGTPTATPPTGTTFASATGLTRTWDWNLGSTPGVLEVSTTLDNPLPVGVARSDLCLTAELTARPDSVGVVGRVTSHQRRSLPPGGPRSSCLRRGTPFCSTCTLAWASPLTLAPVMTPWKWRAAIKEGASRPAGIARDEALLDPERVFVQVKDPGGRRIDTHGDSVNSGTAPSWHTARTALSTLGGRYYGCGWDSQYPTPAGSSPPRREPTTTDWIAPLQWPDWPEQRLQGWSTYDSQQTATLNSNPVRV